MAEFDYRVVPTDHYVRYDKLVKILRTFESGHPDLVELTSIGQSHEGRDIWMLTLTNRATGPADEKPAFWCDGNIHASEVSACTAVLMIAEKLLAEPAILDERTFYLVPRLNPDGAEWALEDVPRIIRSSTRRYPFPEDDIEGLQRKDMDGDGRILSMRVRDPNGPWKISGEEPRLMKRREPGENEGTFYRILPEGEFLNFDGLTMREHRIPEGLDMNRNFPSGWRQEHEQHGAGPFPTSEPEIRAAVQAIVDRPNICSAICFHTYSGVLLRPPARHADSEIPAEDLWAYQTIGAKGKEMTGYPDISVYHDFRYHPKQVITGTFDDWMYEHRGVFAWTVEIWAPVRQAGITDYKYIDWFREHPFEHDLQMLKWSDTELDGKGYVEWKSFTHPQLGEVEIGGWDSHYAFRNPPPKFIRSELDPLVDWSIWHASICPRLALREVRVEPVEGGLHRIRFAVQNTGYLPTNVTESGKQRNQCRGVMAEISSANTPEHWLIGSKVRQEQGQLAGYSHVMAGGWGWSMDSTVDVAVFEWIVKPGTYSLVAKHDRAGTVRTTVML